MVSHCNLPKTMQAIAALFRFHDAKGMSALRMSKLLYIADRESIKETGQPITGDQAVAMKQGPALKETHQLIMGEHSPPAIWSQCYRKLDDQLEMTSDPGNGDLSTYELAKLRALTTRYAGLNGWDLVEITKEFEEWKKNDSVVSCACIPFDEVLKAVGRSAAQMATFPEANDQRDPTDDLPNASHSLTTTRFLPPEATATGKDQDG